MKLRSLLILLVLILGTTLHAQIREQKVKMSMGVQNALTLEIPGVTDKLVGEVWKNYLKKEYRTKVKWNRKTDEWFADDADIASLGLGNTIDIYATAEEKGEDVRLNVWFDLGGAYLSAKDHKDRYTDAEKMLMRFGLEVAKEKTRRELEYEMDELKDLQKELAKLQTANDRYHKEIERAKEVIKKAEEDIVNNEQEQKNMEGQITDQEKVIKGVEKRLNDL